MKNLRNVRAACICALLGLQLFEIRSAAAQGPIATTVCAVMGNPSVFSGRIVKLRATVEVGYEGSTISDAAGGTCDGPWLEMAPKKDAPPPSSEIDAEIQRLHPTFLAEGEDMKLFEKDLNAVVYPRRNDVIYAGGTPKYKVTADMTGRVDFAGDNGSGFGHMNGWKVRFVLSAVENVSTEEISYDWKEFSREPVHFPHGTIRGRLTDPEGRPIGLAWVAAIPATGEVTINYEKELTEKDGTYSLDVKPGKYFIVVSYEEGATDDVPVLTTYFPSSESEAGATPINIVDYDEIHGIDIQIHRVLKPRFFDVQVLNANGKPATSAYVFLTETDREQIAGNCCGVTQVDSQGRARLLAFEGLDYLLWAKLGSFPSEQCAPVISLDRNRSNAETVVARISLAQDDCSQQEQDALYAAYYAHPRRAPLK
jgi:hypothetical protein